MKDLVGKQYGMLTVISYAGKDSGSGKRPYWNVKCSCGTEKKVREDALIGGHTKSCGCMASNPNGPNKSEFPKKDLTGQTFGKLTVIKFDSWKGEKRRRPFWLCKCSCGKEHVVRADVLQSGNTSSCGCLTVENPNAGRKPIDFPSEDLTGKEFNRLKVIKFGYKEKGKFFWLCECLCGEKCYVRSDKLKSGHTKSCGCIQNKRVKIWPSEKKQKA